MKGLFLLEMVCNKSFVHERVEYNGCSCRLLTLFFSLILADVAAHKVLPFEPFLFFLLRGINLIALKRKFSLTFLIYLDATKLGKRRGQCNVGRCDSREYSV